MTSMRPLRPGRQSGWLAAAACAALLGCRPTEPEEAQGGNAGDGPIVNLPVPLPAQPMDRAELLSAVREAASAAAAGADDGAAQRGLDGRPFEIRIRFGCRGPSTDLPSELLGWSFQPERRTLRVRAMPTISAEDPVAARIAGDRVEAVEGFWLPRPWLLEPVCPAAAAVTSAPPEQSEQEEQASEEPAAEVSEEQPAEQEVAPSLRWPKIGIAQFFTATDPRTRRRDMRPYQAVKTLEPDKPIGSQGFNLVLSGRLRAIPGGGVIECVAPDADTPPDCIVSADFDRVWIERPESREIVAEWGSG